MPRFGTLTFHVHRAAQPGIQLADALTFDGLDGYDYACAGCAWDAAAVGPDDQRALLVLYRGLGTLIEFSSLDAYLASVSFDPKTSTSLCDYHLSQWVQAHPTELDP